MQTSPVAGVADATLGKVVAHVAATTLNETLTSTYLDNIYVGFNDMGDQFVTMADGAAKLADGTEELADGLSDASLGPNALRNAWLNICTMWGLSSTRSMRNDGGRATPPTDSSSVRRCT